MTQNQRVGAPLVGARPTQEGGHKGRPYAEMMESMKHLREPLARSGQTSQEMRHGVEVAMSRASRNRASAPRPIMQVAVLAACLTAIATAAPAQPSNKIPNLTSADF